MRSNGVAEPVVSNTNSKKRRGHNTAEPINCISKLLHVLAPENSSITIFVNSLALFPWPSSGNANPQQSTSHWRVLSCPEATNSKAVGAS